LAVAINSTLSLEDQLEPEAVEGKETDAEK
jgi:hypothetical protein